MISGEDPLALTHATSSATSRTPASIRLIEQVPVDAVRQGRPFAAAVVLLVGHWVKVRGVDAGAVPAQVVELEAGGNSAPDKLECEAVGRDSMLPRVEVAVAVLVGWAAPDPARTQRGTVRGDWPVLVDLAPEALLGRRSTEDCRRVARALPACVMHTAPSPGHAGRIAPVNAAGTLRHVCTLRSCRPCPRLLAQRGGAFQPILRGAPDGVGNDQTATILASSTISRCSLCAAVARTRRAPRPPARSLPSRSRRTSCGLGERDTSGAQGTFQHREPCAQQGGFVGQQALADVRPETGSDVGGSHDDRDRRERQ